MKQHFTFLQLKLYATTFFLLLSFFGFGKTITTFSTEKVNAKIIEDDSSVDELNFTKYNSLDFFNTPTDTACIGNTADTFLINSIEGALDYDWIVPTGAIFTQPIGDTVIVVNWNLVSPGIDSIGVAASNLCEQGDTIYFPLLILDCNLSLEAIVDNYILTEDTLAAFLDVQDNDINPTNFILITTITSPPTSGAVAVVVGLDSILYNPLPNFNGIDTIVYQICEIGITPPCDSDTIFITVLPANDPPVANDDIAITDEDNPVSIPVLANDDDPNDPLGNIDPTTVTITTPPTNGTATVNSITGEITYTPNLDFNGIDNFTYQVCDDGNPLPALCDSASVVITVTPGNDAPVAEDDVANTDEDIPVVIDVTANDSDPNDLLGAVVPTSVSITTSPTNGTATVNPITGEITYTSNANYYGSDTLYYQVCDNGVPPLCDTAQVVITIAPVNDPPLVINDTIITGEEQLVTYNVTTNDSDANDPLGGLDISSLNISIAPTNGTATVNTTTGEISYTPNAGFHGTDILTYQICDTGNPLPAECATAEFHITVPVEDCTNGIDDDLDGLVDCMDPDCAFDTPGAIIGNTSVCENSVSEVYTVLPILGATGYTWTVPADATITLGQGTNTITVTWGETSGDVCVTATDGGCDSAPSCITVTTNSLAPIGNIFRN